MKRIFGLLAAVSLATSALAQPDSLTFIGYPKDPNGTCSGAAQSVAKTFATATKAETVSAKCLRDGRISYDLQILYRSPKALQLVVSPAWEVYRTKQACETALEREEKFFTDVSGLNPFLRYCSDYAQTSSWESSVIRLYTPFFYGLGKPKHLLKSFSLEMFEGGYFGGSAAADEIMKKSLAAGLPIVQAYIDAPKGTKNYQSFLRMRFADTAEKPIFSLSREYLLKDRIEHFWAPSPPQFNLDPLRFDSMTSCEAQKTRAETLFADRFSGPVVWFCMWDYSLFQARLYHLRIRPGEESFERLAPGEDGEPFSNEYGSFEACEKDKPRLVSHYRNKLGDTVVGALCSTPSRSKPAVPAKAYVYLEN